MDDATRGTLGKYEIRGTLGRGAMGTVYEGWDPVIARRVAIKTVRVPDAGDSEAQEELARFRREAQAAGRLTHPNIVGVFDYGETAELAYIVMEFVEGRTLKSVLDAQERFTLRDVVRVMQDVLGALQYSHERGVVHRDIKPANIILASDGRAKIADFGIARIESSSMTQAGTVLGTPAYMSPEQFMGQVVTARSDIYSAGVVLYQMLTGDRPFEGSLTSIMHKVLNTHPPKPSELSVVVPPGMDAVVERAMARRPEDRFASAAEFAQTLREAATAAEAPPPQAGVAGEPAGRDATVVAAPPSREMAQAVPAAGPPARGSRLPVAVAAGVALLAVLGGGGAWFAFSPGRSHRSDTASPPISAVQQQGAAPEVAAAVPVPAPPAAAASAAPAPSPSPVPSPQAVTTATPMQRTRPESAAPPPAPLPAGHARADVTPAAAPRSAPQSQAPAAEGQAADSPAKPVQEPAGAVPPAAPPAAAGAPPTGPTPAPPQRLAMASSPAALRAAIAAAAARVPCSLVSGEVAESGGTVVLRGLAGQGAPQARLHEAVAEATPGAAVDWRVAAFDDAAFCQALDIIQPVAASRFGAPSGFTVGLAGGRTRLQDGDALIVRVTMPDFEAQLQVDYLQSDGTVVHIQRPTASPARAFPLRASVGIGDPKPGGPIPFTVSEPYGTDMILAIASARPLFAQRQPETERTAAYLKDLAAAIAAAERRHERVVASALVLETAPRH